MLNDILAYFPVIGHQISYGLFAIPISERTKIAGLSTKTYGVNSTYYPDANEYKLDSDNTLLDMFHGYCLPYAKYFHDRHPDFTMVMLEKNYSIMNRINHAFNIKTLKDGSCVFADARGLTDNPLEFFADFRFSLRNMNVYPINIEDENITDPKNTLCKKAYDHIFKNCALLSEKTDHDKI